MIKSYQCSSGEMVDAVDSKESRVAKNAISKKTDIIELIEITPNEGRVEKATKMAKLPLNFHSND
jgi:hypothetical protein